MPGLDKYSAMFAQESRRKTPVRAFGAPDPGDPEGPGYLGGFAASAFSALPELFGAPATPTAEEFRALNPASGFLSEMAGFAVPYIGAEKIAQLPGVAPKVAGLTEGILGRMGIEAAEAPIRRGIVRELIVNAPVEASRLAVGTTMFPDNTDDLFADVALSWALTGGVGGIGGWFRAGGAKRAKTPFVQGQEVFLAPTHKLKAIEDGAQVVGKDSAEYADELERTVLTENPGRGGASKRPLNYVMPLAGHSAEDTAAINSLFKPERPKKLFDEIEGGVEGENPVTGLVKRYFYEGKTDKAEGKYLRPGEAEETLALLPEGLNSTRDVAKNFQYPRMLEVADAAGAREFAGIMSKPGWTKIGEKTWAIQERDGAFVTVHEALKGPGQRMGKGAGKTAPGSKYFIGKTVNPGVLEPEGKKLADQVTAKWAKWGEAFQEQRSGNVFSEADDALISAVSPMDYHNIKTMDKRRAVDYLSQKFGKLQAKADGFFDEKYGYKDSKSLQDLAESIYVTLKPTMFLEHQNTLYGRFFGLMRNGQRLADRFATQIMRGKEVPKPGASMASAMRGKGVTHESGFMGHRPIQQIIEPLTADEVNKIVHLSNTNKLTAERAQQMVKEGDISPQAAAAVEELRQINEDVINHLVMPVFQQTGHDVEWLKNHLGIPRVARGDLFTEVKNEAGQTVHIAFGKTGRQVDREAKVVVAEAKAQGKDWTYEPAKLKHLASETEQALDELQRNVMTAIGQTPEEGEVIYRAMRKLAAIKGTTGKNPAVPITSGALKKRTGVQTSADLTQYSHQDLLNSMDGHLRQLLRFAGMQNWKERFGQVAQKALEDQDPKLYDDLMRKSRQMLGLEGQLTNALNRALAPVFGSTMGSKAATRIAAAVNETMYAFTLGFINPTFAVLNLLTPLQTVAPWIAHMRTAPGYEAAKMMQFVPTAGSLGKPSGVSGFMSPLKILGQSMGLMKNPTEELNGFFQQALDDGIFHPQLFEEWIGRGAKAQQTLGEAWKEGGMVGFLRKGSTYMGEQSEKMSRLVAFNSAYLVGKEFFKLEGDQLYRFMRRANEVTMFNYHTVDRSRIFTGPVGSMFGLFKNWQMHFMGNMMQYAGLAVNKGNFAPLAWQGASAIALGGLGATPLIAAADGLANWHNDANSSFLWMEDNYGPEMADAAYFGLPAFLGVSLQASSAIPGTDVRNETASLFSFAMWNRAKQLGKALGDWNEYSDATGQSGFQDPNVRDQLAAAITPRAMFRALSVTEGDYVRSMSTGYPQVRGVSPFGRMMHGLGLNMVEVERYQEAGQKLWKAEEQKRAMVQGLGRGYAQAIQEGDFDEAERIVNRSMLMGVELDSVMKSASTRLRRENEADILTRYGKQPQAEARTVLAQ